jgi:RNA polymerase sigma-70 factor (ECF subfamily)
VIALTSVEVWILLAGPRGPVFADAPGAMLPSFDQLYARYFPFCVRVALRVTRDQFYAEDAAQEAFIGLWRGPNGFDPSQGSISTWLATAAHNRAVDLVRKLQRHPYPVPDIERFLDGTPSLEPGPEAHGLARWNIDHVRAGLAGLSVAHRQVLVLAYLYGYSQTEIAAAIEQPLGTVKSRTFHALQALRVSLRALSVVD